MQDFDEDLEYKAESSPVQMRIAIFANRFKAQFLWRTRLILREEWMKMTN